MGRRFERFFLGSIGGDGIEEEEILGWIYRLDKWLDVRGSGGGYECRGRGVFIKRVSKEFSVGLREKVMSLVWDL